MTEGGHGATLVLGLGNVLCSDDGLGVVAVERLRRELEVPPEVRLLDGGTLGLSLLSHIADGETLLLVDAIRTAAPPGTLVRLEGDDVAPAVRERLSVHQIGVADLLDALRLLDDRPRRLTLLGLVPESLELHVGLSPPVEAALPVLVGAVAEELRGLGHAVHWRGGDAALPGPDRRRAGGWHPGLLAT